jgi:hypothetical protein
MQINIIITIIFILQNKITKAIELGIYKNCLKANNCTQEDARKLITLNPITSYSLT